VKDWSDLFTFAFMLAVLPLFAFVFACSLALVAPFYLAAWAWARVNGSRATP
jgi:hypothetical protein